MFPIAASYWSQARRRGRPSPRRSWAATSRARRSPTSTTTTRRARSRCRSSRISPRPRASRCAPSPCRAPGVEMGAQVLDITQRFRPDFVIAHLFGARAVGRDQGAEGQGLSAQQGGRPGLGHRPRPTSSRPAAWAWPRATTPSSSPASARTTRCCKEIKAMYKAQGKQPPKEMDDTVYYNRGVLIAARACRGGAQRHQGQGRRSADRRGGQEGHRSRSRASPWAACVPPLEITPADHEGGGWVQIWTVKGGKLVKTKAMVPGLSRGDPEAPRGGSLEVLNVERCGRRAIAARLRACWRSTTSKSSTTASSWC